MKNRRRLQDKHNSETIIALLVEIHEAVKNLATKTDLGRAKREIVKVVSSRNIDGLDIVGPRSLECKEQVMAVVKWLANPKHIQSLHNACVLTFVETPNGYEDAERLYRWCVRNRGRVSAWIEACRLGDGLG